MKVYLDNCCFNRPFDAQSDIVVNLETKSKLVIQGLIKNGHLELAWSEVLDFENNDNPFEERKIKISEWKYLSVENIEMNDFIFENARKLRGDFIRRFYAN